MDPRAHSLAELRFPKRGEKTQWVFRWQQINPKDPDSASYARYDCYKAATTYDEFIELGMEHSWPASYKTRKQKTNKLHEDIKHDLQRRFLTITDPRMTPDIATELDPNSDDGGLVVPEWLIGRLKLLPKKGDLGLCKNWRGICLLDVASKILSCVLVTRMQNVMEEHGLESQTGFRSWRGTIDGAFNVLMALRKRQEHGLETWACFIDLVKAFDSVPREALFKILLKFGLPAHFVNIVLRLHHNAVMKFKINDQAEDAEVDSMIGVRQGACEGPVLFLFIMQAAIETMKWPVPKPQFCTSEEKCKMHGERSDRKRGALPFDLFSSLFADDCAVLFESRQDMIVGTDYMIQHLKRFGLTIHVGRGATASKTEAMYFPPPRIHPEAGDQTDFTVDGDGFISFVEKFRYLGSHISQRLDSDLDVGIRIDKASRAFGALRQSVFSNKDVRLEMKGRIYVALILTILLYGSECWFLREQELQKLQRFHHDCVRAMCRVNLSHTWKRRIRTNDLLQELGLQPLRWYYETRVLRWAGHVSRMPIDRLPRMLLTSWVPNSRVIGCPRMTFGRTFKKALINRGIWKKDDPNQWKWIKLAAKRADWRERIRQLDIPKTHEPSRATRQPPKRTRRQAPNQNTTVPPPPTNAPPPRRSTRQNNFDDPFNFPQSGGYWS